MNFEATFTPMYIGNMFVKNRLIVPAMDSGMARSDGSVDELAVDYYAARAKGGYGMIIVEIAAVDRRGVGMPCQIDISRDENIPGLKALADGIKNNGSRAIIQLHHAGRETVTALAGGQPVAPSSVPCPVNRETPHELTTEEVYDLIEAYIDSAVRAKEAGYDGVEIHAAHGYMAAQFLSPRSNKRIDEFGGSIYDRTYFLKLIIEGIKFRCGEDYPVIVRISTNEHRIGGVEENEAVIQACLIEEYGADALHLSAGTYGCWDIIVPPPDYQYAWNLEATRTIKQALNVPVIAVGRFTDPHVIDMAVSRGDTDFVSTGRQSIADAEFPNKMFSGQLMDIIPCISCTQRCMSFNDPGELMEGDMGISCMLNPMSNARREVDIIPAKTKKRVMVVGAGPAGLEAAWLSARRGHKVALYDRNPMSRAGGQFLIGAYPPYKQELTRAIRHYLYMCEKYGVEMVFEKEVDEKFVRNMQPDVLIIATGATQKKPNITGIDGPRIKFANEVLLGEPVSGSVLVVGGGVVGVETAEYCTDYCDRVTVAEMTSFIGLDLFMTVRDSLYQRFKKEGVEILTDTKILEFTEDGVICDRKGKTVTLNRYDSIILALGADAYNPFRDAEDLAPEVYIIGDAKEARSAVEAIYEGARTALKI